MAEIHPNQVEPTKTETDTVVATTSNYVYVSSEEFSWVPARLLETDPASDTAIVSIPVYKEENDIQSDGGRSAKRHEKHTVKYIDYPNKSLPLQNVDEDGCLQEVDDMVDLPFLHEVCIFFMYH